MRTFLFLVLVLIIAWLTLPGQEKFKAFLTKKGRDFSICKPNGTRLETYRVFSIAHVDYCEGSLAQGKLLSPEKTRTDKYLGLFGTFWKLPD